MSRKHVSPSVFLFIWAIGWQMDADWLPPVKIVKIFLLFRERQRKILSKWPKNVTMRQSVDTSICLLFLFSKNSIPIISRISNWIYIVGVQFEILGQKQNTLRVQLFYWPKVSVFLLQFNALLIRNFSFANFNWTSAKLVEPIRNFTFQCEAFSSAAPTLVSQNHLGFKQSLIWPPSIILSLSSLSECTQKYSQKMHQKPWVLSVIHSKTKNTHHVIILNLFSIRQQISIFINFGS